MSFLLSSGALSAIPDSVIHRYQFNEGSGTTATDSVGASDGTINGATHTTTAREGSHALSFATDDFVDSNHVPTTDSAFSWMAWVKTTTPSSEEYLLSTSGQTGDNTEGVGVFLNTDGAVGVGSGGGASSRGLGTTSATVDDDSFHLISITFDGATGKIYIDKNEDVSNSWSPYASVENLYFGKRGVRSSGYYNGMLDDVMEANDAVTASEISDYIDGIA